MKNLTRRKFFRIIGAALAGAAVSALPKVDGANENNQVDCTNVGIGDGQIIFKSVTGEDIMPCDSDSGMFIMRASGGAVRPGREVGIGTPDAHDRPLIY